MGAVGAQRSRALSKQGRGLATHLSMLVCVRSLSRALRASQTELKYFSCQLYKEVVQRENQNSPELARLALLSFPISLSSWKDHVGVIPPVGRMEIREVVIGKSVSPPTLCVNEHIAQFGINPQAAHRAKRSELPSSQ